ncbi:hypothetical protein DPEC_G00027790 [Dallia pectoralis]|uniref:Uncharacterized protein n=1 Tax=Dallia pectoralis TaxID=75939 RepID=A0ACC2HIN1_DALPE|nr:hypothetical protein DPEC_G00027790 [Dallia pectoralis]
MIDLHLRSRMTSTEKPQWGKRARSRTSCTRKCTYCAGDLNRTRTGTVSEIRRRPFVSIRDQPTTSSKKE